ncbi:MAG TPA: hypothetical protein VME66_12645 [Candidatus Acidoferrales bacterium]|nr:hypothetical protein [Candidatus Acidoferrales bacterium]
MPIDLVGSTSSVAKSRPESAVTGAAPAPHQAPTLLAGDIIQRSTIPLSSDVAESTADCPEPKDNASGEARQIAGLAVARAMDFAHTPTGQMEMRTNSDSFLNVVSDYMNSALSQRCNPIAVGVHRNEVSGHDAQGHSVRVTGTAEAAEVSVNLGRISMPNQRFSYDQNGLVHVSVRKQDGTYGPPLPYGAPGAHYLMRYNGDANTDESFAQ